MARRGFDDRLTQIYVNVAGGTFGTGLLLNGGVIITARHVIAPCEPLPETLDISVRIGAPAVGDWKKAELIWPNYDTLLDREIDIALIKLIDMPSSLVTAATPIFGLPPEDDDTAPLRRPLNVTAIGFPSFATTSGRDNRRETYQLNGVVQPYAGLVSQTLQIDKTEVKSFESSPHATTSLNWHGFSGAAIFCERNLIGVVTDVPQGSYFGFRGVRIDKLCEDAAFDAALKGAATRASEAAKIEVPHFEQLVYLVDRDGQEGDFVDVHDSGVPAVICLVPSLDSRHLPEDLPERFTRKTLPDRLSWPAGETSWISWPPAQVAPAAALARLRRDVWNLLSKTGLPPTDPQAFRTLWLNEFQPRFFGSHLQNHELTAELGKIISDWGRFIVEAAPRDGRPLVHVILVKGSWKEIALWRQAIDAPNVVMNDGGAAPSPIGLISELSELSRCDRLHIKRWFNEHLRAKFPSHTRILDDLESTLTDELSDFFLEDLKTRVKRCVDEDRRA